MRTARRGAALCKCEERSDLLRAWRDRTFARVEHCDGDRQPFHGDRQYRAPWRGREPIARAEQCTGRLRHGQFPARTVWLDRKSVVEGKSVSESVDLGGGRI